MVADSIQLAPRPDRYRRGILGGLALLVTVALALVGASVGTSGEIVAAAIAAATILVVFLWRVPETAIVFFLAAATLVEQFSILGDGTDRIPLFTSVSAQGLTGVYFTPFEVLLAAALLIWVLKAVAERRLRFPTSRLSAGLLIFMLFVAFAVVHGLVVGGRANVALDELRPWLYLVLLYVLVSQLVRRREGLQPFLWAFTLGTGLKALQGVYLWLQVRGVSPRPEAILAHEEAFFFGVFILMVAGLWLFGERGRLRQVASLLLPFVVIADLANDRRLSWVILFAGLIVLAVGAWIRLPARRVVISRLVLAAMAGSVLYFPLFWNSTGTLGQPARAVQSILVPSARDLSSNQYRVQEDANLAANIKASPLVGLGFGVPIAYTVRIVDLTSLSSMLKYVPHDGALYIWMRLGILGSIAFWSMIGAAFILAASLIRRMDTRVALFGCLALCALLAYLVQGAIDLGFYWYRIAIFMGCLLGAVEGLSRGANGNVAGD